MTTGRTRLRLGLAALLGSAALVVVVRYAFQQAGGGGAFPRPPRLDPAATQVSFADFAGADACAECHRAQYDAWSRSTHARAGGAPTRERLLAPFDGQPIRFRDAVVTPSTRRAGEFIFTVAQQNRPVQVFRVDAVVGGGHMVGGGTQALFSKFPDGTLRFLPFDYSQAEKRWFCQPRRAERGWLPITPAIALADCGAWPPNRVLGSSERFQSCQQCHGSQIEVTPDSLTRGYQVRYSSLGINCESCHGPGRRHVDLARSGTMANSADIGLRPLATLSKNQSLEVCFQCHAAKAALRPRYLPGMPLQEHYALKLPLLLDTAYFADGRIRDFGYQEGHLSSDCYLNGSMTCVDCHEPHEQRYRDANGLPLPGRLGNGQCVACHASKAEPLERHTRHPAASAGSRCVACHMPYLQQPGAGTRIRYARSDHTISIPRPAYDAKLGIESACLQCHRDQPAQRLQAQFAQWYRELKPLPPRVAAVFAADSVTDAVSAARTILSATGRHPMATFAGLKEVMSRYARPDLPEQDRGIVDQLDELASDVDPDVQALALATLHLARGNDPGVRRDLASRLRALGARDVLVRDRWAWILRTRGDAYLGGGDYRSALAAYLKALEVKPDDPAVLRSVGNAYIRTQEYPEAIRHLRRSLELEPGQAPVLVDLGFALMQQGKLDSAVAAFQQATAVSPFDATGYANLGVAYMRRGTVEPAIAALEKAIELAPGLVAAHFTLAGAFATLGQSARAAAALERGLEFEPGNAAARRMLEALRK